MNSSQPSFNFITHTQGHRTSLRQPSTNRMAPQSQVSPFLSLPAELRLQIYSYLIPGIVLHAAYFGLLQTCHMMRIEYNHEIRKYIRPHYPLRYDYFTSNNRQDRRYIDKPYRLSNIHILNLTLPNDATIIRSTLVPFHLPWVEQVYITLRDSEHPHHEGNMVHLHRQIERGIEGMRNEGKIAELGLRKIVVWEILERVWSMNRAGQEGWRDKGWEREFGRVVLMEKGFNIHRNEWRRKEELKVEVGGWLTWTERVMGWFV
ncbi:hypothetical protein FB567DRAFT_555421 [Paraphoma chrysanthemicola]|uniref:F-box domain-containing protein n=1 Tax=Paraphoma chrysanthemicola TaxID=798071 RepID=A0A8K0QSQ5_9PLEO|nr:hypothetical protein FB567DRAFT_555421 [Paraphoma chrysanthemicola]